MPFHYNTSSFWNTHSRQPIACPWGQAMGCLLCVQSIVRILLLQQPYYIRHHLITDCGLTKRDCTSMIPGPSWALIPHDRMAPCSIPSGPRASGASMTQSQDTVSAAIISLIAINPLIPQENYAKNTKGLFQYKELNIPSCLYMISHGWYKTVVSSRFPLCLTTVLSF